MWVSFREFAFGEFALCELAFGVFALTNMPGSRKANLTSPFITRQPPLAVTIKSLLAWGIK
jgi:hypothetical protein